MAWLLKVSVRMIRSGCSSSRGVKVPRPVEAAGLLRALWGLLSLQLLVDLTKI